MRYLLTIGDDEDGPVLVGDDGLPLAFPNHESASTAARYILKSAKRFGLPDEAGVFVQKMVPTAFYLPVHNQDGTVTPDETVVHPEKDDSGGGEN